MYATLDFSLPFAASLILFFLLERVVSALLSLFFVARVSELKQAMSSQYLVSCVEAAGSLFCASAYSFLSLVSSLLNIFLWISVLLVLGSVFYVAYEQSPSVWTDMIRSYNAFLGPFIQNTVIEIFNLLNIVFKGIIPLWNSIFYFISRVLQGYLLPTVVQESPLLGKIGVSMFSLAKHSCFSLFHWIEPMVIDCPQSQGDACFDLSRYTLDLVTPLADFRQSVIHFTQIIKNVCQPSAPLLDILTYPFMDLNFATSVHYLVNSVLYACCQMPALTYLRCTRYGSDQPLLCTPDMDPVYSFLVTGIRNFGHLLDNWMDVAYVVVQSVLGWSSNLCQSNLLVPPFLSSGAIKTSIFGSNQTALVGLSGWLMAVTDGYIVSYYGQGAMRIATWPSPIDISLGLAAVTYSRTSGRDVTSLSSSTSLSAASTSTSLFGCKCYQFASEMKIQCTVLPYEGLLANQTSSVPVFLPGSGDLRCSDIDIHVQSVRWPQTRYSTTSALPDCTSRTCGQVDATVWVVPRASCDPESTQCQCFPFCMATRLSASQSTPLVMYSADQWRSKVFIVKRDCNLQSTSSQLAGNLTVSSSAGPSVSTTQVSLDGSQQFVLSSDTVSCTDNLLVTSLVNRSMHTDYSVPTASFLRDPLAPFVITGDTIMTAIKHGDGQYTVRVERLVGNTGSEFTLSTVSNNFPANPPPNVPSAIYTQYPRDHLTMPYARQATLSVSSRDYVFYAVNPAMDVYDAYINYCKKSTVLPQFGLIMASSFSPIRIWRVDAYRRCSSAGCGFNLVEQVDIPDAFSNGTFDGGASLTSDCLKTYNEGITQLEYINDANIAVTVKHTDVNGSFVDYRVYWLNAQTMQLQFSGPWQDETTLVTTAIGAYSLCPSMQVLPEFGSMLAELANAAIYLVKMVLDTITYFPGIVHMWKSGTVCPLNTHGHSILQQCGSNAFLLDDFFSSLQTATNIFWSSLTMISSAVGDLTINTDASRFVQNILNGAARYGSGSIDLWTASFQVLNVMKTPSSVLVENSPSMLLEGMDGAEAWQQGGYKLSSSSLGWARFGYTSLVKMVITVTQNVLLNQPVGAGRAWRIVVNTLDEMRDEFDSDVVDNLRQSCAGISLMMGQTNPWAVYIYQQCIAANTVVESGIDLILSIFNLAPFTQCMCSGSSGKVFGDYAMVNCVPQASTRLRPVLLQMIQTASTLIPTGIGDSPSFQLCKEMIDYTKTSLVSSVQPWFDAQFSSMNALASSVDYTMAWFDVKAGDCLNYNQDPDVVVIMPYPSDYFQACGSTSLCRSKCSSVWDAFDKALAASTIKSSSSSITVQVESLFFPTMSVESFNPMTIKAITEPSASICFQVCGPGQPGSCIAVAGIKGGIVVVQYYCVPTMMTSSVYRTVTNSLEWQAADSSSWFDRIYQLRFGDEDGAFIIALTESGQLYGLSFSGSVLLTDLTMQSKDPGLNMQVVSIIDMMSHYRAGLISIHINLLYRVANGQITAQPLHRKLVLSLNTFPKSPINWQTLGVNNYFNQIKGFGLTQIKSQDPNTLVFTHLLLPASDGLPMNIWTVNWDTLVANGVISWSVTILPEIPSGIGNLLGGGQILSQNCYYDSENSYVAFVGSPSYQSTMWLSQARISGATAQSYQSQPVSFTVQTTVQCDVKSCLGCPDGEVQKLCDAVQSCTIINCIGTPVNMRRVLCQLGQTLADESREALAMTHGMWVMFVDMFMVIMDLSLQKGLTGITISWPDDSFFGYICTVKDQQAHFVSMFTSALNSVVQIGHSAVVYLQGGAHQINNNFNAMATMTLTALTSFVSQIFLGTIYPLIVSQKIMMCQAQGFVAIFDATGFTVTLGNSDQQAASNQLVGHCMTQNYQTKSSNPTDASNAQSTAQIVTQVSQSVALAVLPQLTFGSQSLETIEHILDAWISYFMGILSGLADVLQSLDMSHCKLPDYFLNETVFCACGDIPFAIPPARKREGLADLALWCTGTLSLLDTSNVPFVIYNPYTYAQLQDFAVNSDAYLACVSSKLYVAGSSTGCDRLLPNAPALASQGVSALTVLTACKANYINKQWDKASHVVFDMDLFRKSVRGAGYPKLGVPPAILSMVSSCLLDPVSRPSCLQDYLAYLNVDPEVYWLYEDISPGPSQFIDACQVFTGPANNSLLTSDQQSTFRACLDQYHDSNCQLSSNLWTPQSDNVVPVAYRHAVLLDHAETMQAIVRLKYQQAHDMVIKALAPLASYNNKDLQTIFFSPEGDIMHQMMDCVFMGPYNKVNYWPGDSKGTLPVPTWYRDANGSSRAVDPRGCITGSMDNSPPYSCGSHSRQAVIKYFFRDYLTEQNNATMNAIITTMAAELSKAWGNISTYSCLCQNHTQSILCCNVNGTWQQTSGVGSWLPPTLNAQYQSVSADIILRALTKQLQDFYRFALEQPLVWTKYLDQETNKSYQWSSDPTHSATVKKEALYWTHKPVIQYDATEARSPMVTTALWQQCHGLLSQIFFTIPMQNLGQWVPRNLPTSMDGAEGLQSFIYAAVQEAFMHSPLYRHYNVSYVPSDSKMCRNAPKSLNMTVGVSSFIMGGNTLLDGSGLPTLKAHGPDAFPFSGCFCGWTGNGSYCFPPPLVCQSRAVPEICPYFPVESLSAIGLLQARWNNDWPCPALEFSDQWGILDSSEMSDWLIGVQRNYRVSGSDLIKRGRTGMRLGNYANLSQIHYIIHPSYPRSMEPSQVKQPNCASDYLAGTRYVEDIRSFVKSLFPVAQGVYESSTTSYCLRYAVESAFLTALEMAQSNQSSFPAIGAAYASQRMVSDLWMTRCEGQIALLALCKGLDVYAPPVRQSRVYPCPFSIPARDDVYMTPGCLVSKGNVFYDPCNCGTFTCGPGKPLFSFDNSCAISFDPRSMIGDNIPLGGWKVSPLEVFDRTGFVSGIMSAKDSMGNVPRGGDWKNQEGFLNTTGRHCDMLADWWPTDQTLPVGYHATTTCSSDTTGYRTFDSAFAVERTLGQYTVVKMVYQHDITRNASSVDTQAGSGGLCSGANVGLPMVNTNTMLLCTRIQSGQDTLDPALPVFSSYSDNYGQEQCSGDSLNPAWFDPTGSRQDSSLYSVGTVPNMPSSDASSYPQSLDYSSNFGIGPKSLIESDILQGGNGFGGKCSDFALTECVSDKNCPSSFFCLLPSGVCMHQDFKGGIRCTSHGMCPNGMMCDGTGRCAQGYIVYLNKITDSVEASVFAEKCDDLFSDTYYTDGASPWEYVPDWLKGHGMCSNKNWYMYNLNVQGAKGCSSSCQDDSCTFNAHQCSLPLNGSKWWPMFSAEPMQFAVKPTLCDRDYEHLRGPAGAKMVGCTPKATASDNQVVATIIDQFGGISSLSNAKLFRNFNSDGSTTLAKMPLLGSNKTGFLGLPMSVMNSSSIVSCEAYTNCYAFPFTYNGVVQSRLVQQGFKSSPYNNDDIFRCGVFAYYNANASRCYLDKNVLNLYNVLCNTPSILDTCSCANTYADKIGCTPVMSKPRVQSICANILPNYAASYKTIQNNLDNLQTLFSVFIQSDGTLSSQVSGVECFQAIHSGIQSTLYQSSAASVYYPFMFALHEIPLAWVYQCMYLAGVSVDATTTHITCQQYEMGVNLADASTYPSGSFNFNFVRGGYTRRDILQSISSFSARIHASIPSVSGITAVACNRMGLSNCDIVPYCATRMDWLPNTLLDDDTRNVLAAFYQTECKSNYITHYLSVKHMEFSEFIGNYTALNGYGPDPTFTDPDLKPPKSVMDIINDALAASISWEYDIMSTWPYKLTFPLERADVQTNISQNLFTVLSSLSMQLITSGALYTDVDQAYMPNKNINDINYGSAQKYDIDGKPIFPMSPFQQGCIFRNLSMEQRYYGNPSTSGCIFDGNMKCQGIPCKMYPLTYLKGTQGCKYPIENAYTSLSALVNQVWNQMADSFTSKLKSLPPFPQPVPVEPVFFTASKVYFSSWTYDISDIKAYTSNINPDTTKEVMCVISSADTVINYTTCNDDNYMFLQRYTDSLRQKASPIVPGSKQMTWRLSRSFLSSGAIFAFASTARDKDKVLLQNILDPSTRCGVGEQMSNRVCLVTGQAAAGSNVRAWVPWLSGQWNPYEKCDVQIFDQGSQEVIWPYDSTVCPECSKQGGQYKTYYMYDRVPSCDAKANTRTVMQDVGVDAPTNLCYIQMKNTDSVCTHPQGMVGGNRGQSVLNHPKVPNLYEANNVTGWPNKPGGIFPRSNNKLFQGQDSQDGEYGFLSVPEDEIGLVMLGLVVEPVPNGLPSMRVYKLALQAQEGYMPYWESLESVDWVPTLQENFLAENALHASEQQARGNSGWDCPLRRAAFYSASIPNQPFAPPVPSPARARKVFGSLTGNLSSHPTQTLQRDGSSLGLYTTSNGFCFCPSGMQSQQTQCQIPLSDKSHPCSLYSTIAALQGTWTPSFTFSPLTPGKINANCTMQFDWPYLDGKLRDMTMMTGDYTLASDPAGRKCHLLDRLKPFQYRYKSAPIPLPVKGTSNLERGGVCHTGRAAVLTPDAKAKLTTTRCVKQSETSSQVQVSCEDGTTMTLAKEQSTPLDSMVDAVQSARLKCSQCPLPPTFVNARGDTIKPQSSFGIPFRFSVSRTLAADLKGMLCGSLACPSALNLSAWNSDEFVRTLLLNPSSLFSFPASSKETLLTPDNSIWNSDGWVFCNTTESLKAGACQGSIPESSWRADRFTSCYNKIRDITTNSPDVMSTVDVCLIDSNLQDLCTAISEAQSLVKEANCLASGSTLCALKPFLYQPSMWDVSNKEFVHSTVSNFYKRVTTDACPGVVEVIQKNNQAILNRCAATPVAAMSLALQACRDIVDALAQVFFYSVSIVVDGLMMAFTPNPSDRDTLKTQIIYYWNCIVVVIKDLLAVLSDIVFDMLFHMGSLGMRIYQFLQTACGLINTAYRYWRDVWCGIALDMAPGILGAIRLAVQNSDAAFKVLNSALDSIFMFVPSALSRMESLGFTKGFRGKISSDQIQQKQSNIDNAKNSHQEGKSADSKKRKNMVGGLDLASAGISLGTSIALEALGTSKLGLVAGLADTIMQAAQASQLASLYPENWTIFDFDSIYYAIDSFEYYISHDNMCLKYRAANASSILPCDFPPLISLVPLTGTLPMATRCWADSQQILGASNLLSCTESDTCYKSLYDRTDPVVCGACPSVGDGYSVFGCDSLTKMCTCKVPTTTPTGCTSNFECGYATATCQLITGLDDMSYGNQPCTDCTKDIQCIIKGGVGACGCIFQSEPLQQCNQPPGQRVTMTSSTKMCGYLPNADMTRPLSSLHWDSISLINCVYLKPASIYCVQVYQGSNSFSVAVGLTLGSFSWASRRLLSEELLDMPQLTPLLPEDQDMEDVLWEDWNQTAEPCRSLARYHQNAILLGPLDTMQLDSCARWRLVGRETIKAFNLTSLRSHEHFLLSADDFSSAIMQRWVLLELLSKPQSLLFAASHSPLLKPIYSALMVLRSFAMTWGVQNLREIYRKRADWEPVFNEGLDEGDGDVEWTEDEERVNISGRRLMSLSNTDIKFAETWLSGPFSWPPNFYTQVKLSSCNLGFALFQIAHDILTVLVQYYYGNFDMPPAPPKGILNNLPNLTCSSDEYKSPPSDWTGSIYHFVWNVMGINPGYSREFLSDHSGTTNIFTVTTSMLKCDFKSVTFCSAHKKDLLASVIILFMFYVFLAYFSSQLGVSVVGTLFFFSFVPFLLFYSYGMALTCVPMLPSCLMDDVVGILNSVFPEQVTIPRDLQVSPDCLADSSKSSCLIKCSDPPVLFVGWRDTFAYGLCSFSKDMCVTLAGWVGSVDPLGSKLSARASMLGTGMDTSAYDFCFGVTFINIVPVVILIFVMLTVAIYFLYLPLIMMPKVLALSAHSMLHLHEPARDI